MFFNICQMKSDFFRHNILFFLTSDSVLCESDFFLSETTTNLLFISIQCWLSTLELEKDNFPQISLR